MSYDKEPNCPAIRVILADSSYIGNQLLSNAFPHGRRLRLLGIASCSQELLSLAAGGCDVAIVAANLEKVGGGIEVTRQLRTTEPHVNVVLLLDNLQPEAVVAAFRAGANGIVGRSQSLACLWKCIACVHAGQIWAGSRELHFLLEALQKSMPSRITNLKGISLLSEQEQKVVCHVCEGLTNREIARRMNLSEHTIKNHLFRIYSRLGISSRVEIMFSVLSQRVVRAPQAASEGPVSETAMLQTYLKHAEHSPLAQFMLGKMHLDGRGTEKDMVTGYMWLTLAEQTALDLLQDCRAVKTQVASQIKHEEKTQAETRAAQQVVQPRWRSAVPEVITAPLPFNRRSTARLRAGNHRLAALARSRVTRVSTSGNQVA